MPDGYKPTDSAVACQALAVGGPDRVGEEVGEGLMHEVQLRIELLADPFGHGDRDVDDGEAGVHAHPVAAHDGEQVEQDAADLDVPQPLPPVPPDELDDRGAEALEPLGVGGGRLARGGHAR